MKIVFIAPFGIRPKGTVPARMLPLAVELQRLGHIVCIVAPPYTNPEDSGKVETVRGVVLRNIALGPFKGAAATPFLTWRLYRAGRVEQPDLVHLFKPKGYGGLSAMIHLMGRRMGRRLPPLFVDTDDWEGRGGMNEVQPYSNAERRLFDFQEAWLPPRACGVTVASRTLQTQVWGMGVAPERVAYIPNGVSQTPPSDGAPVRRKWAIPETAPVLMLYTRFFEFDQDKLYFVFEEVYRRVPAVHFLVIGKGRAREEDRLMAAAKARGFSPALRMAGWLSPEDIPAYLAAGDVAIYPLADTLYNRAKCPAKLTELLLAERAVVADNVGQAAEYIHPGVSGLLCDPDRWEDLAQRAVDLLLDPERRCSMGREGARYILEKFSWKGLATKLEAFYMSHRN